MTSRRLFPLALIAILLAGCSHDEAPTVEDPPPTATWTPLAALPQAATDVRVGYALASAFNADRQVATNTIVSFDRDGTAAAVEYLHPDRPSFDSRLDGLVAADGSWASLEFGCEPVFPDSGNSDCASSRGGYAVSLGLDGPFFGALMIAGLPINANETLSRVVTIGTQSTMAWFQVTNESASSLTVAPLRSLDPLVYDLGHANTLDPLHCSIFSGQVTLAKEDGLPLGCAFVKDEEVFPVWERTDLVANDSDGFAAKAPESKTSGRATRPEANSDSTPFPLAVAFEVASGEDDEVAQALSDSSTWLGTSTLVLSGATQTGSCPACVTNYQWTWAIRIHAPDRTMEFEVVKSYDSLLGAPDYAFARGADKPAVVAPDRFPAKLVSPSAIWDAGRDLLGFSPYGLIFQQPRSGTTPFIGLTGAVEPYYSVVFADAGEGGLPPQLWYRADGSLEVFMAKGAQPHPLLDGMNASPCLMGCVSCPCLPDGSPHPLSRLGHD